METEVSTTTVPSPEEEVSAAEKSDEMIVAGKENSMTANNKEEGISGNVNNDDNGTTAATTATADKKNNDKSALQDNIDRKGKNAYYFAHAHKATGPQWDGKMEPRLLARLPSSSSSSPDVLGQKHTSSFRSSFEYHKSNITNYAFLDEKDRIKIYVNLLSVGDRKCQQEGGNDGGVDVENEKSNDITLDYTSTSLCLIVRNYNQQEKCLSFGRLYGTIDSAFFRVKKDKIILTLVKSAAAAAAASNDEDMTYKEWPSICARGDPEHELVWLQSE